MPNSEVAMTKDEFKAAFQRAQDRKAQDLPFDWVALDRFVGFGLRDFEPVHCTLDAVADLIRYQAQYFNGGWDHEELNNIAQVARRKFVVIG